MNVYRQQSLSTTILNNVLQNQGVPPFFGNKVLIPFVSILNSDMSVLHMNKIDLLEQAANDKIKVEQEPVPFLQGLSPSQVFSFMYLFMTDIIFNHYYRRNVHRTKFENMQYLGCYEITQFGD